MIDAADNLVAQLWIVEAEEPAAVKPVKIDLAGAVWGAGRVLTHLGATADIVRGHNTQHWRLSRSAACTTSHSFSRSGRSCTGAAASTRHIWLRYIQSADPM